MVTTANAQYPRLPGAAGSRKHIVGCGTTRDTERRDLGSASVEPESRHHQLVARVGADGPNQLAEV